MTHELADYFASYLDASLRHDGERCPGEHACQKLKKRRLVDADQIQAFCQTCALLPTKPGMEPTQLADFISTACRLDELKQCGATFAYPDALGRAEWQALIAYNRGRSRAEDGARRRAEHNARVQAQNAQRR